MYTVGACLSGPVVWQLRQPFFAGGGWLGPSAKAQERGATLTAEMAVAVKYRPSILLVCQWNEWAGQPDGKVLCPLALLESTNTHWDLWLWVW